MCDCNKVTGVCSEQVRELKRLRVEIKTLQRVSTNSVKKKEYRQKALDIETLIEHYSESKECPGREVITQVRNYVKNEQAESNK